MTRISQCDLQPAGGKAAKPAAQSAIQKAAIMRSLFLAVLLMMIAPAAFGQALPAAEAAPISTGFSLPRTAGTLQYAVSASESLVWGYYGNSGAAFATNLTGDLAYLSNSKRNPFSMVLAGGHSWSTSGQPSFSYVSLGLSQIANAGRWNFVFSDNVNYMPGTPTVGLSGIAGVGDLGVSPVQVGVDSGQGVLSNFSSRVTNVVSGTVQRQLTGKTSINGSGSASITRFLDTGGSNNGGLDSNSITGGAGISHQYNERTSLGGNYAYSTYSYSGDTSGTQAFNFVSQTASVLFTHRFTRKWGMSASAGPQWTLSDYSGSKQQLSAFVDASVDYAGHYSSGSLAYVRSTNSGFGAIGGSLSDSLTFVATHPFAVVWSSSFSASYTRTESLPLPLAAHYKFDTTLAGVQVSRALVRSLSTYASFTVQNQSSQSSATAANVFNGLSEVVGFGLTYSPMSVHLGRP